MTKRFDIELEDYRLYFVIGALSMFLWITLPLAQGMLSSDLLVGSNAWFKVGGQLIFAGIGLAVLPCSFRFPFLVVFAIYLTDFSQDVLNAQCQLAEARFTFNVGEMPTCLFHRAI